MAGVRKTIVYATRAGVVALAHGAAFALEGRVVDEETRAPLANVTLSIVGRI